MLNGLLKKYWIALTSILLVILVTISAFVFFGKLNKAAAGKTETAGKSSPGKPAVVDIIEISDFHAEIEAVNGYPVASALYSKMKQIKDTNPGGSLVVGVGDLFDNPPMSKELGGTPTKKILERFGMEATALGNHEFYWGDLMFSTTLKNWSVQVLNGNMYDIKTGKLVYEPYKIFDKNGVRIAVISVSGAQVEYAVKTRAPSKYYTTDSAAALNKYAEEIRAENKADIIIALVHDGGSVSGAVQTGSIFDFARKIKGVDILYGGHSHTTFITKSNGINILNAGSRGRGLIHTNITISNDGTPPVYKNEYVSIGDIEGDPEKVDLDEEIENIIAKAKKDTKNVYSEVVGYTDRRITKAQWAKPFGESELGDWVTDVIKEKTGADVGLHSNNNLGDVIKGKIISGALADVSKKSNVYTAFLSKGSLKQILEDAFRDEDKANKKPKGEGIQVSGIRIKYDMNRPSMDRIVDITREDGTPIADDQILKVALQGRMIAESDNRFLGFKNPEFKLTALNIPVYKYLTEDVKENGGVIKVDRNNRIQNVNGGEVIVDNNAPLEEPGDDEE